MTSAATSLRSASSGGGASRERKDKIPMGSIVFVSKDPFNQKDLVDPVLASGESEESKAGNETDSRRGRRRVDS